MPSLEDRVAIVTGANGGLGLRLCQSLAAAGADVIMACRDEARGDAARDRVLAEAPDAAVTLKALDLADQASIAAFAAAMKEDGRPIDILINNAGLMGTPRALTKDGFERQFGVNHLGHFALTGRLSPLLLERRPARVVTVTSLYHKIGKFRFEDIMGERRYKPMRAYAQSKLANMAFALEFDRRLRAAGAATISLAAHPGYAATNLQTLSPKLAGKPRVEAFMRLSNALFAQSARKGADPILTAAAGEDVMGGELWGPGGIGELHGKPKRGEIAPRARDRHAARRLWSLSEDLTGVRFELPEG